MCVSPLSSLRLAIHPFVALPKGKEISPSAEGEWSLFEKSDAKTFQSLPKWLKSFEGEFEGDLFQKVPLIIIICLFDPRIF